jgi:hypothetical protein
VEKARAQDDPTFEPQNCTHMCFVPAESHW